MAIATWTPLSRRYFRSGASIATRSASTGQFALLATFCALPIADARAVSGVNEP
jgi:hypothetical protein